MKIAITAVAIAIAAAAGTTYAAATSQNRHQRITRTSSKIVSATRPTSGTTKCPKGFTPTGGGFTTHPGSVEVLRLVEDTVAHGGWTVKIRTFVGDGTEIPTLRIYAICEKWN